MSFESAEVLVNVKIHINTDLFIITVFWCAK